MPKSPAHIAMAVAAAVPGVLVASLTVRLFDLGPDATFGVIILTAVVFAMIVDEIAYRRSAGKRDR